VIALTKVLPEVRTLLEALVFPSVVQQIATLDRQK
jgi:hypothetical protein